MNSSDNFFIQDVPTRFGLCITITKFLSGNFEFDYKSVNETKFV